MVNPDLNIPQAELSGRLQRLMFLRVLFVSLLLGASVFMQVRETKTYFGDIQTAHYVLIGGIYFLTVVYILLLKVFRDLVKFAYLQLLSDTFLVSAIVFVTGGIESIFSFLYILTIINGSILLYRKGGMIIASSSSILYGLLLDLHYYGLIRPIGSPLGSGGVYQSPYIFYMIVVNIAAFYVVAFLSSYPSEQARRSRVELQAKQDDIVKLEALNEWIIHSITSGLITLDSERKIILFNPAAEEMFGLQAGGAIGRRVSEVLPFLDPYLAGKSGAPLPRARRAPKFIDLTYDRVDGKRLFLRCSLSPLSLPEVGQKGEILFIQDLTEMKEIEEEMKRVEGLALIGELAAGIAHEVRNPLASISGSIQMLKDDLEKSEVSSRLMEIILREIGRLNTLVSDFLLFARPKQVNVERFELNHLMTETLTLFRNRGPWTEKILVATRFSVPIYMESDPEQIRQILWNLLLNACEAMPEGGQLHISSERVRSGDATGSDEDQVRITIRDTGEGFSDRALGHLFTPFFTTKDGGTGLGLAIVKRIAEGLRGAATGKNHPDGGAEITISLPSSTEEEE
ncbi:MAG: PAS domain S-box protein [Deltaproteobacteria bacterium]|nr:PAS domain S-box protein [Deltaproteobacteria bacterium]